MCLLSALCVWSGWGRAHTRWEGLPRTAEFQWCLLALMECFSSVWLWHCPFWNLECLFRESLWRTAVQSCSTVALACQTYCRSEWGKHGGKHLYKELLTWGFDIPTIGSCCLSIQSSSWFGWNMSLIISIFLKILWTLDMWTDTHSIWPCLSTVLLSEGEFLKLSLSSPKATDSHVSCVQMLHLHGKMQF